MSIRSMQARLFEGTTNTDWRRMAMAPAVTDGVVDRGASAVRGAVGTRSMAYGGFPTRMWGQKAVWSKDIIVEPFFGNAIMLFRSVPVPDHDPERYYPNVQSYYPTVVKSRILRLRDPILSNLSPPQEVNINTFLLSKEVTIQRSLYPRSFKIRQIFN